MIWKIIITSFAILGIISIGHMMFDDDQSIDKQDLEEDWSATKQTTEKAVQMLSDNLPRVKVVWNKTNGE